MMMLPLYVLVVVGVCQHAQGSAAAVIADTDQGDISTDVAMTECDATEHKEYLQQWAKTIAYVKAIGDYLSTGDGAGASFLLDIQESNQCYDREGNLIDNGGTFPLEIPRPMRNQACVEKYSKVYEQNYDELAELLEDTEEHGNTRLRRRPKIKIKIVIKY